MQDEYFMRDWNAGHSRFSADLDRALRNEARQMRKLANLCGETSLVRKARLTGTAVITGVAAGVGLGAFLLVLAALATPETGHAAIACMSTAHMA